MNTIYIFGHKKPDTDSICASISLSYLKNTLGYKTIPMALGDINSETRFVLDYFNIPEPKYLNDVKLQVKDVDYIRDCYINAKTSINNSYLYMKENGLTGLPIVDDNKKLIDLVTLKDLAKELIQGDFNNLNTSYDNIVDTLKGTEVLKFDDEIKGDILAAAFRSTTFLENIKLNSGDILIVGDRRNILEYAVNSKVKLIILVGDADILPEVMEQAKNNKVNIIKTPLDTYNTTKLINLSNYICSVSHCEYPICIDQNEYYSQFEEIAMRNKHTNYPIVNKNGECLGLLPLSLSISKKQKQVILVDHNEKEQSVDGLEEATIVEVIDHHKLGTLATNAPINFRNMAVGSTNTIIYGMYKDLKIDITPSIAGIMLAGILSDTMILKSPTTTKLDVVAVNELSKIVNINYQEFGMRMFKAGSSLTGKSKEEIIYDDFKKFKFNDYTIGIGQVLTTNVENILKEKDEYIKILNESSKKDGYNMFCFFITDIINSGSYMLYNSESENILADSYDIDDICEGYYLKNIVSRKKQIIPPILEILEKYI